jgi:hypothetical protein
MAGTVGAASPLGLGITKPKGVGVGNNATGTPAATSGTIPSTLSIDQALEQLSQ